MITHHLSDRPTRLAADRERWVEHGRFPSLSQRGDKEISLKMPRRVCILISGVILQNMRGKTNFGELPCIRAV